MMNRWTVFISPRRGSTSRESERFGWPKDEENELEANVELIGGSQTPLLLL